MSEREVMIHRFFRAVDAREWDGVAAALAERVRLDYTSLFGGEPDVLTPQEVLARWQGLLPGFEATMHLLGPLVEAGHTVGCNVRGYHHLDGRIWMVAGWYTLTTTEQEGRHRIAGITFEVSYQEGDRELITRAAERAAR